MTPRPLICIPTYNNSETIEQVVIECLKESLLPILILDDGSQNLVEEILEGSNHPDLKASLKKRIKIHRFEQNQGKGAAIQKAFKLALEAAHTHLITIDGDGQHKAYDLKNIEAAIEKDPWSLIIGKRKFIGEHVPSSSKFGRKFSNFWVKYQTSTNIEDSQSGFRSYPLFFVQNFNFFTKKYDFEIEVLIRLLWKKVFVQEIEVDVYYPPPEIRVSHFDKLWDNVKISLLNTVLVIVSLLKENTTGLKTTLSLATGVFFAVQPIYGLQVFFLGLAAFIFKLNFSLMFLASQISIPPLIPLWTYLSLKIGFFLTGKPFFIPLEDITLELAKTFLSTWVIGSLVLGLLLGGAVILTSLIKGIKNTSKNKAWTGKDRGGRFGNAFMRKATLLFGPKFAYLFLYFIAPYFYLFAIKGNYAQNIFFKQLYPKTGLLKRQFLVLKTFLSFGKILIDNIYTQSNGVHSFKFLKNGNENLKKALGSGNGLILVGAHIGGWMLASKIFQDESDAQTEVRINIVQYNAGVGQSSSDKIKDDELNYINSSDQDSIFKINGALKKNEALVFMADRRMSKNIELIPFLGKLAIFDSSPFRIAVIKKAPICLSLAFKKDSETYDFYISPPIIQEINESLSKDQATFKLMQEYVGFMEERLKKYPHQWFNFFPYWSSTQLSDS